MAGSLTEREDTWVSQNKSRISCCLQFAWQHAHAEKQQSFPIEPLNRVSLQRKSQWQANTCLASWLANVKNTILFEDAANSDESATLNTPDWALSSTRYQNQICCVAKRQKYLLINQPSITARPGVIVSAVSATSSDVTPVCVVTSRYHHHYHQLPWWLYSPQCSVQPRTLPNLLTLTNANTSSYITVVVTRRNGEVWLWVNRRKVQNKPFKLPNEL